MSAQRWPITVLLGILVGSAAPSPDPPEELTSSSPFQVSSPFPTTSSPSHPLIHLPASGHMGAGQDVHCPLKISAPSLVVRFGDSFTANCSVHNMAFSALGWEVSLEPPGVTMEHFLVWSVNRVTEWNIDAKCFALSEQGGPCHVSLPLTVYKLPGNVSIDLVNHTGPMLEARQYTLQCAVWDVAPVQNLTVTFYRGQKPLGSLQSTQHSDCKRPMTERFTLSIEPSRDDDQAQYWCEARLDLKAAGQQRPLVVSSQNFTATVFFGPQLECPTKLQVREGETFGCEVRGNPQPLVTWFRDGQAVALPAHSSRKHAGKYTVWAEGYEGQKTFVVEVEVIAYSGTTEPSGRHLVLAVLLLQIFKWL